MVHNSLQNKITKRMSPPSLAPNEPRAQTQESNEDLRAATRLTESDNTLKNTLKAFASLALIAAPQMANAAEAVAAETEMVLETENVVAQEESGVVDKLEDFGDRAGDFVDKWSPENYFDDYETKIGDYDLRFRPLDLDLRPKWKDGGPGLQFKGEAFETTISKSVEMENDWTMRQGVSARLRGEVSTYDEPEVDLEAGVFREYSGPVGKDFQARIRGNFGIRQRFVGEDEGLRAGFSFRQDIEGGNYEFMGHDYQLYAEGRQGIFYNADTGKTEASYKFMVGPKKDFKIKLLGREGTLSLTVGPQIKGSTNGDSFDPGISSKARIRF